MSKNIREVLGERALSRVVTAIDVLQNTPSEQFDLRLFCDLLNLAEQKLMHRVAIENQVVSMDDTESPTSVFTNEQYVMMNQYLDFISDELMINPLTFCSFLGTENADNITLFMEAVSMLSTSNSDEDAATV